ncbi:hypothetical protein HU200_055256 [Digitaria exilis]|uniref:LysM domain-containing protein n=1 Tax=Digitaria exilis TaxID=1010633 RepID=A0A835AEL4_9POAL|nr:hypothetical protein HU200_055256 [Digitaria exilis]
MANHRAAALLIASLLVAVAIADADAAKVPALTCSEVHAVKVGETCFSIAQAAGLTQEQFLGFNPNINCEKVFIGQWVCIAATSA